MTATVIAIMYKYSNEPDLEEKEPKIVVPEAEPRTDERQHQSRSLDFYLDQVAASKQNPGLYVWGSNKGGVAAPDSPQRKMVKRPTRIPFFDGMLLRDVKLQSDFGAAVTEKGDLVQWGQAYEDGNTKPEITLKGRDIVKIAVSLDRILVLTSSGSVYSIPVAKADQLDKKPITETWLFWTSTTGRGARILTPKLGISERVIDIKSGLQHCLILTNSGRVFSAAASSSYFPEKGQMGIPDLKWETRPPGPYDQPHEVDVSGAKIKEIATGDYHSVLLDKKGDVYGFGDNAYGQVGDSQINVSAPEKMGKLPKVSSVAAGGNNTFFMLMAENPANPKQPASEIWAVGHGTAGSLGSGRNRPHITTAPVMVKRISGVMEWDEKNGRLAALNFGRISVGASHTAVSLQAGKDVWPVYVWGANDCFELGTRRRVNEHEPVRMAPLDGEEKTEYYSNYYAGVPKGKAVIGEGQNKRTVGVEQRVECGRNATAVYMAVCMGQ